jgi:hypothetical protein
MAWRLVLLLVLACLAGCTGLFFQPMRQHVHSPMDAGVAFRDIALTASDGVRLHAWVLPAQGEARGVVVFLRAATTWSSPTTGDTVARKASLRSMVCCVTSTPRPPMPPTR